MDIERLHNFLEKPSYERQSGKTFSSFIVLLGEADFNGPDIFIICPSERRARWAMDYLIELAEREMGFKPKRLGHTKAIIGLRTYETIRQSRKDIKTAGKKSIKVYDD